LASAENETPPVALRADVFTVEAFTVVTPMEVNPLGVMVLE
jgi:hypothetical protein